jgi:hypothetical protein
MNSITFKQILAVSIRVGAKKAIWPRPQAQKDVQILKYVGNEIFLLIRTYSVNFKLD